MDWTSLRFNHSNLTPAHIDPSFLAISPLLTTSNPIVTMRDPQIPSYQLTLPTSPWPHFDPRKTRCFSPVFPSKSAYVRDLRPAIATTSLAIPTTSPRTAMLPRKSLGLCGTSPSCCRSQRRSKRRTSAWEGPWPGRRGPYELITMIQMQFMAHIHVVDTIYEISCNIDQWEYLRLIYDAHHKYDKPYSI